jgi:predicted kinase
VNLASGGPATRPRPLSDLLRRKRIATLHLICGLPCSGKTILARQLEHERSALRLTPDEWITRLFGTTLSVEALDAARDPVEGALWDLAARVLELGVDVILDFGFWSRSEREVFRARAARLGARSELHFTDASEEQLLARLAVRNAQLPPGTFWIEEARMREWIRCFEAPGQDELQPREGVGA